MFAIIPALQHEEMIVEGTSPPAVRPRKGEAGLVWNSQTPETTKPRICRALCIESGGEGVRVFMFHPPLAFSTLP